MGCSNSTPGEGTQAESKEMAQDSTPEDKRRNYGGVYVGIPADAASALCSTSRDGPKDPCVSEAQRKELRSDQKRIC